MFIFSITGENKHYGTPTNPAASSRTPGGSSSGAAVAVAADLVDFSLGELLFLILSEIVLYFLYISSLFLLLVLLVFEHGKWHM